MQDFRLDRTANIILTVDGGMAKSEQVQFLDDAGVILLVLICRTRLVLGVTRRELVVNSTDAQGRWKSEIVTELPDEATQSGIELRFCDWQVELSLGGRQRLLSFNPSVSFGPGVAPYRSVALRTNIPASRLRLATGRVPLPDSVPAGAADQTISLIVLHHSDEDTGRVETLFNSGLWFADALAVDIGQPEGPTDEAAITAALDRARGSFVALFSGDWELRDVQHMMRQYVSNMRPDAVMLAASSPAPRPGDRFAAILPRLFLDRPSLRFIGGLLTVHPRLYATGYRMLPFISGAAADHTATLPKTACLPVERDEDGRLVEPILREAIQLHALVPEAAVGSDVGQVTDVDTEIGQIFGGLHIDRRRMNGPITVRRLLIRMRDTAETVAATHFTLWVPGHFSAARCRCWPCRALYAQSEVATDADGNPAGFLMSRETLTAAQFAVALATLPSEERDLLDAIQPDVATAIRALAKVLYACNVLVGYTDLAALDGWAQSERTLSDPLWIEQRETVARMLLPVPDELEPDAAKARFEGPDGFETTVLQALQYRHIYDLCQHVLTADLRFPEFAYVEQFVEILIASGHADDDEVRFRVIEALLSRSYVAEALPLLRDIPGSLSPLLQMQLTLQDIRLRDRLPSDRQWLQCPLPEVARKALADGLPNERTVACEIASALISYCGHREDWEGILNHSGELPQDTELNTHSEEMIVMARIRRGLLAGLAQEIKALAKVHRISAWSQNRFQLMLAEAQANPVALSDAVTRLLQTEDDMAPLLNPPSRFRLLGSTTGRAAGIRPVGHNEISCIIVARNEFVRLKWLHRYYRALGVDRFFLIDNMSDDQTLSYFSAQPDVTVLQTDENYRDTRYGVKWHNEVADAWLEDRWVLTVDADEALVFDGCEHPGALHDLVARLEAEGAEGYFAPMLDMYSQGALSQTMLEPGDSLIERFPMLDSSGYFFSPKPGYPQRAMTGGVRLRLFWQNWHVPNVPRIVMQKVPLVRWKRGFRYLASTHDMTPLKVANETGALLHFKFLPDFHARALEEVRRNQHYEGAREYRIYAEVLSRTGNGSFVGPTSVRFEGYETLAGIGVVTPAETRPTDAPLGRAWAAKQGAAEDTAEPLSSSPAILSEGTARQLSALRTS